MLQECDSSIAALCDRNLCCFETRAPGSVYWLNLIESSTPCLFSTTWTSSVQDCSEQMLSVKQTFGDSYALFYHVKCCHKDSDVPSPRYCIVPLAKLYFHIMYRDTSDAKSILPFIIYNLKVIVNFMICDGFESWSSLTNLSALY